MHDLVNNKLTGSFDEFISMTNESNYDITTRQRNRLYITRLRTTFSPNLKTQLCQNLEWNSI